MNPKTQAAAEEHAREISRPSVAGWWWWSKAVSVTGRASTSPPTRINSFSAADYAAADDAGEIVAVVHSHPSLFPDASMADQWLHQGSWHIYALPLDRWHSYKPKGYEAPLVGREWCYGISCYSLARDWYAEQMGLKLGDYERRGEWWNKGLSTFVDNFMNEGCGHGAGDRAAVGRCLVDAAAGPCAIARGCLYRRRSDFAPPAGPPI